MMASQVHMDLTAKGEPVTCLGQTFANDDERREHFRDLLRQRLADPAFRTMPGFPNGSDEDIVQMSDPPYYTACPNPFIADAIRQFGIQYSGQQVKTKEPFASDVTEGKNDVIYNAHSYHTKVPPKAITKYIDHYSSPGDVIVDVFCGTGMTGVAAQQVGDRLSVNIDLSPIATFIASKVNRRVDASTFLRTAHQIVERATLASSGTYETAHSGWRVRDRKVAPHENRLSSDGAKGQVEFILHSDVVSCPECAATYSFYGLIVDDQNDKLKSSIPCPSCDSVIAEKDWESVFESSIDPFTSMPVKRAKTVPVLINYTYRGSRFEKVPDDADLAIEERQPPESALQRFPSVELIAGRETRRNVVRGITHIHHFFYNREITALSNILAEIDLIRDYDIRQALLFSFTACLPYASKMRRFRADRKGGGPLSGTLYVGSMITPPNAFQTFIRNAGSVSAALASLPKGTRNTFVSTQSATSLTNIANDTVDYIFVDPPFGYNFDYSELNFFWEAFIGATTNQKSEAIISQSQGKALEEYEGLLTDAFTEMHRILKPGRWMTVEFSNTQASVWNAIQVSLQRAGFVVSNVSALDKKQNSFKAVMTATAVKQDLIISAYKPNGGLEERLVVGGATETSVWDFVSTHLSYLPTVKVRAGKLMPVPERDARRIFDRMIAWFVRHNMPIPLSSGEFQAGLAERFLERDGMFFLPAQVDEYDKRRMQAGDPPQRDLFVDDERTAIDWLADYLKAKPSTYQEVHPDFTQKTGAGWRKHELKPELLRLLEENFLKYDGDGPVPSQIHAYLSSNWRELRNLDKDHPQLVDKARSRWFVPDPNKQQDVEARRDKALLREFDIYKAHKGKKMKEIRLEVMRVGFKAAWAAKDYRTIIDVSAKVPDEVWQEDERLMMLHSMAETRLEAER